MRSVSFLPLLLILGCGTGPLVTACVSDPPLGLLCYNEALKQKSLVPYNESDHYVCMPPEDAKTVLNYCSSK